MFTFPVYLGASPQVWMGGYFDRTSGVTGQWKWLETGALVTDGYQNWNEVYPVFPPLSNRDCLAYIAATYQQEKWVGYPCDSERMYVCY